MVKRALLATVALFLIFPLTADGAFVQRKNAGPSTATSISTGNFSTNPTTGNLIVVLVQYQGTLSSVTDTLGNTYTATPLSPYVDSSGVNYGSIYYAKNITGGSANSVTANFSGTAVYSTITAYEVSGADTTSPFVDDGGGKAGSGTNITTDTITVDGSSFIAAIIETDSGSFTAGSGYTRYNADGGGGYVWDEYKITSSNSVADGTGGSSAKWYILGASFKDAPAAVPTSTPPVASSNAGRAFVQGGRLIVR